MNQMRRVRANQQGLKDQEAAAAEDPASRIRQVELDTIKMLLLENHLLLLLANDAKLQRMKRSRRRKRIKAAT